MKPKIKKENEKEKHNDRSYKRNPREDNYTLEENIHTFLEKNKDTYFLYQSGRVWSRFCQIKQNKQQDYKIRKIGKQNSKRE